MIVFEYQTSIRSRRATNKNIATKFSKSPVCRNPKRLDPVSYYLQGSRDDRNQGGFYNQELEAFRYNFSQHRPRHLFVECHFVLLEIRNKYNLSSLQEKRFK